MCHCSPILAIHPSTRRLHNLRKMVFLNFHKQTSKQTNKQTEIHRNSMTESAQCEDLVKMCLSFFLINCYCHYFGHICKQFFEAPLYLIFFSPRLFTLSQSLFFCPFPSSKPAVHSGPYFWFVLQCYLFSILIKFICHRLFFSWGSQ